VCSDGRVSEVSRLAVRCVLMEGSVRCRGWQYGVF
jgi:hypothetical protein